jgi:hypothetical protein
MAVARIGGFHRADLGHRCAASAFCQYRPRAGSGWPGGRAIGCVRAGDRRPHSLAEREWPVQFAQSARPAGLPGENSKWPRRLTDLDNCQWELLRTARADLRTGECPTQQSRRCRANDHGTACGHNRHFQKSVGGPRLLFHCRFRYRGEGRDCGWRPDRSFCATRSSLHKLYDLPTTRAGRACQTDWQRSLRAEHDRCESHGNRSGIGGGRPRAFESAAGRNSVRRHECNLVRSGPQGFGSSFDRYRLCPQQLLDLVQGVARSHIPGTGPPAMTWRLFP